MVLWGAAIANVVGAGLMGVTAAEMLGVTVKSVKKIGNDNQEQPQKKKQTKSSNKTFGNIKLY